MNDDTRLPLGFFLVIAVVALLVLGGFMAYRAKRGAGVRETQAIVKAAEPARWVEPAPKDTGEPAGENAPASSSESLPPIHPSNHPPIPAEARE